MATTTSKKVCFICKKNQVTYMCSECSNHFCFDHLLEHRTNIEQEFDQLQNIHDQIRQQINDFEFDTAKHPFIKQINQWEIDSIHKIKQQAELCRTQFIHYSNSFLRQIEEKLSHLARQIKDIHQENAFNEIVLKDLKQRLDKLERELNQPTNVSIRQQPTLFINKISLLLSSEKDIQWKEYATIIAGGNGKGDQLNQLNLPHGIFVDNYNQIIYIADFANHRIVEWNLNRNTSRIVAGENGRGNQFGQLNQPTDVIIDRQNNDLIIADCGNSRVMRCSRQSNSSLQILIDDIECMRLTMHEDGSLYVSDRKNNEVRRWKKGEKRGTIVAGGNGKGNQLNQLSCPTFLFIDDDHTLYISDHSNNRVMKWIQNAKEGIVVAGGNGQGHQLTQLSSPQGLIVDRCGQVYVVDSGNNRVMRWREGEMQGTIVVGGKGKGRERNQFDHPAGLSFDSEGNLYVVDCCNTRIVKFERDLNSKEA